ncbi:alpha-glucan family phosphorylase [Thermodesulfobacteriota bacterium]
MTRLQTFQVFPAIPQQLSFLEELFRNFWWCWQRDAVELFRRIDPPLWEQTGHNPILFSTTISQNRLEELSTDASFLAHQKSIEERFETRVRQPIDRSQTVYGREGAIAYFSMEFGIHESLPIFAGGLGMLAGDHLKAASNLALPLVGVGLMYRRGYFRQFLDQNGWQQEEYPEIDLYQIPVERALDQSGHELRVSVAGPDDVIHAIAWKIQVGRIPLFLLDTNLSENPPHIRDITSHLYAGESKMRLAQEILLGIGGLRALEAVGIIPKVIHMNEGHAAFAALERLAQIVAVHNIDIKTALEIVPRTTVFTTHTPVAAGYDEFPVDLVKPYLSYYEKKLGVKTEEILSWGQAVGTDAGAPLSMFVLAMRMSRFCNGVSGLHGKVARRMWAHLWANRPFDEIPISHITNGVHIASWISPEISQLFERYLGPDWSIPPRNPDLMERIDEIYAEELWHAHERSRTQLIRTCRELMVKQYGRRNAPETMMKSVETVLDQDVLTIGFARRFATYKRAYLLFQDPERLEALVNSEEYPVQFVFAGKAHPKDNGGKEVIKRIVDFSRNTNHRHRIIFLEDYDPHLARHLVQGADIWLNTPRRPFEACGTSGMKAAINGVLNVSTLDGWWCEGYSEKTGWRIGDGEEYADSDFQDIVESQALYNILENDVIPSFYDRRNGEVPGRWVEMMKASMKMAMAHFSSHRMITEYAEKFYRPAAQHYDELTQNHSEKAQILINQRERFYSLWDDIRIEQPVREAKGPFRVGETFDVSVLVHLGQLSPEEVDVELYYGRLKALDTFSASQLQPMAVREDRQNGVYLYACKINCAASGRYGFMARLTPRGDNWIKFSPGLLTWS